jgi:putative ABC transport system permease protein
MIFRDAVRVALLDLALHKFRSGLATLGIIFGVASVEAMMSISAGAERETLARISALGVDNIIIRSAKPDKQEKTQAEQGNEQWIAEYGLLRRDLDHVRQTFPSVRYAIGQRNTRIDLYASNGKLQPGLSVIATEPQYIDVTRSQMARGRFLNVFDEQEIKQVCVVGAEAARKLFAYHDPLAQSLRIRSTWYRVVGVLENTAAAREAGGDDINHYVFIPLVTARAHYGDLSMRQESGSYQVEKVQLDAIAVQMADPDLVIPIARRMEAYLAKTHKRKDYNILVPLELMRQKVATQRIFTIVTASIASISLLIGGIGIMNIMLANVSERRQEIGTRRAIGATRKDIMMQFVLESATLTSLGGTVGVAVGYGIAVIVSRTAGWPTSMSWESAFLGLAVACGAGILFGLWPAYQAAKVNPIEALRAG